MAAVNETSSGQHSARADATEAPTQIAGDRGIPSINRSRSMQARVSNALAIGLMAVLGAGLIGWYYSQAFTRSSRQQRHAQGATTQSVKGEMTLRPLGPVAEPVNERSTPAESADLLESLLGPRPDASDADGRWEGEAAEVRGYQREAGDGGVADQSLARRLGGEVLNVERPGGANPRKSADEPIYMSGAGVQSSGAGAISGAPPFETGTQASPRSGFGESIQASLQPAVIATSHASVLPTQQLLLPKGAFIDCTLETAIDSTLPGMTTCITATDTFGVDGSVVLLERGTKLVGETRGSARRGASRIFVVWTEARTPHAVIVPLASPGTDELGRSGLSGDVDRHFFERFGAAILISVIDGAVQAAAQSSQGDSTVIYNPSGSQSVLTEILRDTLDIPPTIRKAQGDRIQVLVARDLDFRSVYELRDGAAH